MMRLTFVLLLVLAGGCSERTRSVSAPATPELQPKPQSQDKIAPPIEVERCVTNPAAAGKLEVRTDKEPYYLGGDFDGDGAADYAVAVRGPKSRRNGVLICGAQGKTVILGADNPLKPAFSDMPNDNFVSATWKVFTKEEAAELHDINKKPPIRVASPKGDAIAMIWEDGICVIWWDGSRYRWGCGL